MYAYGRGFDQNFHKAASLLERSARSNHAPSLYYMGLFKVHGYGCMPDYETAFIWFERAAVLDDPRVSEKAALAAKEIKELLYKAEVWDNQMTDKYIKMSKEFGDDEDEEEDDDDDDENN